MTGAIKTVGEAAPGEGFTRGGLGFFSGLLLCGAAMAAQALLLHAIAGQGQEKQLGRQNS